MQAHKPILCVDFDGVLHTAVSGWQGPDVVLDDPVPGAIDFIANAVQEFQVHVFSSRSSQKGGIKAMEDWLIAHLVKYFGDDNAYRIIKRVCFPTHKPPAHVTLDDRALCFTGIFPSIAALKGFRPWNKQ